MTPSFEHVESWLRELSGPVAVAYEAGPTGFGLHRHLTAAGFRCVVVAPSELHRRADSADQVDALKRGNMILARLSVGCD